ncbi:MAG: glycosyltransferase family 2 protein [Patescibacteria group bacterium]
MPALSKPSISVIIPTLNSGSFLNACLASIRNQSYPSAKIHILIADGGSTDSTLKIAKTYHCRIFQNKLKTAEAGKALLIKKVTTPYLISLDSDNILPSKNWISEILKPLLANPRVIGSESIAFTYRRHSGFIERYSALLGANDPYAFFTGVYDRYSHLTNHWTGLKITQIETKDYLLIDLKNTKNLPTIGANGTLYLTSFIQNIFPKNYFFDTDILSQLKLSSPLFFAKVKNDIIHSYCEASILKFIKKQKRRVIDLYCHQRHLKKLASIGNLRHQLLFLVYSLTLIIPIFQSLIGFIKKPDPAWFFHPLACFSTALIYTYYSTLHFFGILKPLSRNQWRQ